MWLLLPSATMLLPTTSVLLPTTSMLLPTTSVLLPTTSTTTNPHPVRTSLPATTATTVLLRRGRR